MQKYEGIPLEENREDALMRWIHRSVYEDSIYGIAVFMSIGRIIALNKRGREILGYQEGDMIEVDVRSYFYGEDSEAIEQEVARMSMLEQMPGQKQSFSHRCMRTDGEIIWLEGKRERITLEDGTSFILSTFTNMTEQKQAEERLHEEVEWNQKRRRMLLELYDSIPVGILQQTTAHPAACVDVNRAAIRLLGFDDDPKDFLKRDADFFSCVSAGDRQAMEDVVSVTHLEESRPFEVRLQTQDGSIRWIKGEVQRLINLDGEEILQFCFSDNTEQKSIEMALEEERRRNKLIADSTSSVIMEYIVKTDTAYKFRNMRHKDGRVSSHHLTIHHMSKRLRETGLIHPEDCRQFEFCLSHGYGSSINVRMRAGRTQPYIWHRAQFSSFYEHGALSRVLCIMDNIQNVMEMESEKEILTELCHLIVSSKYEMIDLIDVEEGEYHYYITERERWKSMPQSGNYDELLLSYIVPMAYDRRTREIVEGLSIDKISRRLEGCEIVREYLKLKDGDSFRWKLVEFSFLKSDRRKIFHILSDVHDERNSQERLEQALAEANKANAAKNDFLANISHEIRTPMNAIIGISDLLLNKNISKDMEDKLISLQRAGNGLLEIINGILDFSKIEAGKTQIVETTYNLTELVSGVIDIMLAQIVSKPVRLFLRKQHDMPEWMVGDEIKTRQILLNILGNAVKFTDKGFIKVNMGGYMLDDGRYQLEIRISDSGRGIREADQAKVFEAFDQVDDQRNRGLTGTGLGLPISRKLARLMDGDIWLESAYGEGSTFTIHILQKIGKKERNGTEKKQNLKKILVLEGDQELAAEMRWNLNNMGFSVAVCQSLDECQDLGQRDVIFLRSRTLQKLKHSGVQLPSGARLVLAMEQNELISREFSGYDRVQIPLFGVQAERLLFREDYGWNIGISPHKKSCNEIMPGARVLVVDDNEVNRMVTEEFMRPYQVQVSQAENGSRALQLAAQEHFDLVFMDQMMPGMDGVETAGRLREMPGYQHVPVVALTADATEETRVKFEEEGFAGYLIKPIHMEQLEQVLREHLAAWCQPAEPGGDQGEQKEQLPYYFVLLQAYRRDVEAILTKLPEVYEAGDRQNFTILVHRLKGASSEVGAAQLEEQAAKMERYGKNNEWELVTREFDDFMDNIRQVLTSVEENIKENLKKEDSCADIVYRDSFDCECVTRLNEACDQARYSDVEGILEEMIRYRYGERDMQILNQMRELSESLRYDELEQLVKSLPVEGS